VLATIQPSREEGPTEREEDRDRQKEELMEKHNRK